MRHISTAFVLLALTALLGACGEGKRASAAPSPPASSSKSVSTGTQAGLSANGAGDPHPTRAQAIAFGRALNLTAADVPDAKVSREKKHKSANLGHPRCEGSFARGPNLAEVDGPLLTRGSELETEEISSGVTVRPNAPAAARDLAWLRSGGGPQCIARALSRHFGGRTIREGRWGRFSASSLPIEAPGVSGAIGFRIATTLSFPISEVSVPIYFDIFAFLVGAAEVAMTASSATQPVPQATEQRLLSLLLARAGEHPL
jgi:hypothetical protein